MTTSQMLISISSQREAALLIRDIKKDIENIEQYRNTVQLYYSIYVESQTKITETQIQELIRICHQIQNLVHQSNAYVEIVRYH